MKKYVILALFALCFFAYTSGKPPGNHKENTLNLNYDHEHPLYFKVIKEGGYSNVGQKSYFFAKNDQELKDIWHKTYARHTPIPTLPNVDFSKYFVLAIFYGEFSSGGPLSKVSAVTLNPNHTVFSVVYQKEDETPKIATQALSQPYKYMLLSLKDFEMIDLKKLKLNF